jgi:hypothetical protein
MCEIGYLYSGIIAKPDTGLGVSKWQPQRIYSMTGTPKRIRVCMYQGHKNTKDGALVQGMIQGTLNNSHWKKPNSLRSGIIRLFPARESLVSDIPAGDGKIVNLFYSAVCVLL